MGDVLARTLRRLKELFRAIFSFFDRVLNGPSASRNAERAARCSFDKSWPPRSSLDDFSQEVEDLFTAHLTPDSMAAMSKQIRAQLNICAKSSPICMLPSFNHALPTGKEDGTYLAMDLGGSTFRVALVQLSTSEQNIRVVRMVSSRIDENVKQLEGKAFFDWMAEKIAHTLDEGPEKHGHGPDPLPMGLSWSFPIDQTSVRSGRLIAMGKGFLCSNGTVGDDLADLITQACRKQNLNVRIDAIVNDSSATLLSRAYMDPSTRMSLILGTGTNVAIHFPVHAIGIDKFGDRPTEWFAQAKHVIVNTELSMFGGGGVLPTTRWDDELNRSHIRPDYQPLEYMATGRYLGEIVRLIIVEAVESAGLFGGELPASMESSYSFDTAIASCIEQDTSPLLQASSVFLQKHHDFPVAPTSVDMLFLQKISKAVSRRAAAYIATAIHGLWCLRNESESPLIPSTPPKSPPSPPAKDQGLESLDSSSSSSSKSRDDSDISRLQVAIACEGTVINKYPNFRTQCQEYLDLLTREEDCTLSPSPTLPNPESEVSTTKETTTTASAPPASTISLDPAPDTAIFGAAVAVAIAKPPIRSAQVSN